MQCRSMHNEAQQTCIIALEKCGPGLTREIVIVRSLKHNSRVFSAIPTLASLLSKALPAMITFLHPPFAAQCQYPCFVCKAAEGSSTAQSAGGKEKSAGVVCKGDTFYSHFHFQPSIYPCSTRGSVNQIRCQLIPGVGL